MFYSHLYITKTCSLWCSYEVRLQKVFSKWLAMLRILNLLSGGHQAAWRSYQTPPLETEKQDLSMTRPWPSMLYLLLPSLLSLSLYIYNYQLSLYNYQLFSGFSCCCASSLPAFLLFAQQSSSTEWHPEKPKRVTHMWERLQAKGIVDRCQCLVTREATDAELACLHTQEVLHCM